MSASIGAAVGVVVGATGGAVAGTVVLPVAGTLGGGAAGAAFGSLEGAVLGAAFGGAAENLTGAILGVAGASGQWISSIFASDDRTADEIISTDKKGSIRRQFPGELLGKTLEEINRLAKDGDAVARRARKLLKDNRFNKGD